MAGEAEAGGRIRVPSPWVVIGVTAAWLAIAWGLFLTIDAWDWLGWRAEGRTIHQHLFNDRFVEWLQWVWLTALVAAGGVAYGRVSVIGPVRQARFWLWFGLGAGAMLLEDAGDIRHPIREVLHAEVGSTATNLFELAYMLGIAALPLYAVVRYGRDVWRYRPVRGFLAGGVVVYAIAAAGSTLARVDLYRHVGRWFHEAVAGGQIPGVSNFWLADSVLEETLELVAVGLLLAAALAYLRGVEREPERLGGG